jgi:predicted nucleic acid-binding protein
MNSVFVDTDIVLDLLGNRKPFYRHAAELFTIADRSEITIFVSSLSFSNLNYILSKQYSSNQARKILMKFKTLVTVLSVSDKVVELALLSDFKDFEDALQYYTALENGVTLLLTRNLKDFKTAGIPIMTAEQYLKKH